MDTSVSHPPKPARTWAAVEKAPLHSPGGVVEETNRPNMWRTEAKMNVNSAPKPPAAVAALSESDDAARTDTASRRSISQKRSLFEGQQEDESVASVDPSMLTMAQRRALFDKNRTAPKPIARFGEAVTPAMLNRYVIRKITMQ